VELYYANRLHVAEERWGSIVYYHQDHLGSTRLKMDGDGNVVYESNYMPFGPDYDGTGSEEFKYTSKHQAGQEGIMDRSQIRVLKQRLSRTDLHLSCQEKAVRCSK